MIELENAMLVRERILGRDGRVEFGSGVANGREYRCWYMRAGIWDARVTNLSDLRRASGRAEGDDVIPDRDAVDYERLEVFPQTPGGKSVFEFLYRIDTGEPLFLRYDDGLWPERYFGIGLPTEEQPDVVRAKTLSFMSRGLPPLEARLR